MNCYCYETDSEFVLCVEDVESMYENNVQAAYYAKEEEKFQKTYPKNIEDKELIKKNFSRLGESMFTGNGNWQDVLLKFAKKCYYNNIEWYITGSISESVVGVKINPHDIDIVIHVKDFFRIKEIFSEYVVEPFFDHRENWVLRYFGRLCFDGVMIDVVADDRMNKENHTYVPVVWNGYNLNVEPLQTRYQIEIHRGRKGRVQAIEAYLRQNG